MKTAMQELWICLDDAEKNSVYELGTQNFKRYIEDIYLEKEKQQIIDVYIEFGMNNDETNRKRGEEYYNETYKN
jgi:NOL1/NOP2/fmu family ribosome biogenesis protein